MNITLPPIVALLFIPGGLFLLFGGLVYEYADRKLVAQFQNRVGPRWFQPLADIVKLLAKEEIVPDGVNPLLFHMLPVVATVGTLTAALYVPMAGLVPAYSFKGDLVVTLYLLSLMTMCMGLAGANTINRFALVGATRALTQLFSYEAPFLLALLGPAIVANTWQISEVNAWAGGHWWIVLTQPVGFLGQVDGQAEVDMSWYDQRRLAVDDVVAVVHGRHRLQGFHHGVANDVGVGDLAAAGPS